MLKCREEEVRRIRRWTRWRQIWWRRIWRRQQPQLPATATRLSGYSAGTEWNGTGTDSLGNSLTWTAILEKAADPKPDTTREKIHRSW